MTLHPQAQSRSRARFLADRIRTFIQSEAVLAIAALAAVASMAAFPPVPDNLPAYLEAIDLRTIGLLFCLMTVVAGLPAPACSPAHAPCSHAGRAARAGSSCCL